MKHCLTLIFALHFFLSQAQIGKDKLTGDWKFYLSDNSNFEFLRLNKDGTGIKCFGQTIDGKDTLFKNHITTLLINSWYVEQQELVIESSNGLSFKVNPVYKLAMPNDSVIQLTGEHLIYHLYPSWLNRQQFSRTVTYQKATSIFNSHGVQAASCILDEKVISFKPVDSHFHWTEYKGFTDLIPHIVGCNHGYTYTQHYLDPGYRLTIPTSICSYSFGFGDKLFYISLNGAKEDTSETAIVIFYDFGDQIKNNFFARIKSGKEKKDIARENNKDIYRLINWEGKYEGRLFLDNSMYVAYYTKDKEMQATLQKCIASFEYK